MFATIIVEVDASIETDSMKEDLLYSGHLMMMSILHTAESRSTLTHINVEFTSTLPQCLPHLYS